MSKLRTELLARYYFEDTTNYIEIYGCYESDETTNQYDFYDVFGFDGNVGECLNEGNPLYEMPTRDDILKNEKFRSFICGS
jgi:hypothetical protein